MSNVQKLQDFTDGLYKSILKHLPSVVKRSEELLHEAAVTYARSGNPEDRKIFLGLEARANAAKGIAEAMLDDTLLSEAVVDEIHKAFPDLAPDTVAVALKDAATLPDPSIFSGGNPIPPAPIASPKPPETPAAKV